MPKRESWPLRRNERRLFDLGRRRVRKGREDLQGWWIFLWRCWRYTPIKVIQILLCIFFSLATFSASNPWRPNFLEFHAKSRKSECECVCVWGGGGGGKPQYKLHTHWLKSRLQHFHFYSLLSDEKKTKGGKSGSLASIVRMEGEESGRIKRNDCLHCGNRLVVCVFFLCCCVFCCVCVCLEGWRVIKGDKDVKGRPRYSLHFSPIQSWTYTQQCVCARAPVCVCVCAGTCLINI